MLEAKVKDDSRFAPITSCSGITFFRETWMIVPHGFEAEAQDNPYLDTRKFEDEKPIPEPAPEPTTSAEVVVNKPDATDEAIALASEMKLRLSWITGTGKDNRILKSDVEKYLDAATK